MANALDEFIRFLSACSVEVNELQAHIDEDHLSRYPDYVDWSDVRDAKMLLKQLREINDSLHLLEAS